MYNYTAVKVKQETWIIAQDNPAYDYIKTEMIVTQRNTAYEDIQKFHTDNLQ